MGRQWISRKKGSASLKCKNGEELVFYEVYFISSLCNNIISLGHLSKKGNKIVLKGTFLWVYDDNGRLIIKFKRSANRLYNMIVESSKPTSLLLSKLEELSWLWLARLRHINFQALTMMFVNIMAHGLPKITQPKEICDECLVSKKTRKPFPHQTEFHATRMLELIHVDLCWPITQETNVGNKYFYPFSWWL